MANLKTNYMGIELNNPVVVGASSLSKKVDTIRKIEDAGAGALVIKSLFEEQIQIERHEFTEQLDRYDSLYSEAVNLFPNVEHGGPKEHLFWIKETRKAVKLPLIASLNAINESTWVEYAMQLEDTGVDGIELNFYSQMSADNLTGSEIEKQELDIFSTIRNKVKVPLSVKLHPFYTNLFSVATSFDQAGADSLVLFNRLFQPTINIETQEEESYLNLSDSSDNGLSLRWIALLYENVKADLIGNTGIMNGSDAIKTILAGANAVQVVSTIYKNDINYLAKIIDDIATWMKSKGYNSLDDFRGKASKKSLKDPWSYERAQYIKALLGFD